MHYKSAHTYTQEQINYDERILFIDRSAGSGADIIAKGWKENHWARPTMVATREKKFHTLPKLEDNLQINFTELTFSGMKSDDEGGQKSGQSTTEKTTKKTTEKVLDLLKSNPYLTNREMADMLTLSEDGVFYQIKKLKAKGIIVRIGGDKGGHWEIIDK